MPGEIVSKNYKIKITNGVLLQEEIAKDLLSGDYEEETQSSADDLTPSVTSHEATDFFPRTLRCEETHYTLLLVQFVILHIELFMFIFWTFKKKYFFINLFNIENISTWKLKSGHNNYNLNFIDCREKVM